MNFRTATLNDAEQLDNLLTKLIADEKENYDDSINTIVVKDFYKNYIGKDGYIFYLCEYENEIVGYIYAFYEEINKIKIDALYVKEDFRNKRIATKLLSFMKNYIKENNVQNLDISVLTNNKVAKGLYQKFGFVTYKEVMRVVNREVNE